MVSRGVIPQQQQEFSKFSFTKRFFAFDVSTKDTQITYFVIKFSVR